MPFVLVWLFMATETGLGGTQRRTSLAAAALGWYAAGSVGLSGAGFDPSIALAHIATTLFFFVRLVAALPAAAAGLPLPGGVSASESCPRPFAAPRWDTELLSMPLLLLAALGHLLWSSYEYESAARRDFAERLVAFHRHDLAARVVHNSEPPPPRFPIVSSSLIVNHLRDEGGVPSTTVSFSPPRLAAA